jgi:hypothetical protein
MVRKLCVYSQARSLMGKPLKSLTMRVRLAQALWARTGAATRVAWHELSEPAQASVLAQADVTLRTMRNPTEYMLTCGQRGDTLIEAWQLMIDAELEASTNG